MTDPAAHPHRTAQWQVQRGHETLAFEMALDPADATERHIFDSFGARDFYEPDVSRLFLSVLRPGDIVFDVGANCGYFTLLAGALVGQTGRVLAIEPGPATVQRLNANIAKNRLPNIAVVDAVANDGEGEATLHLNAGNAGGHALWEPGQLPANEESRRNPQSVVKRATTLDTEWKRLGAPVPKLIKIDTEGAEERVVSGARELLSGAKVPFVVAELHEFGLARLGATQRSFRALMQSFGYATFGLYFNGAMPKLIPAGTRLQAPYEINLLFATEDAIAQHWPVTGFDPRSTM